MYVTRDNSAHNVRRIIAYEVHAHRIGTLLALMASLEASAGDVGLSMDHPGHEVGPSQRKD